MEPILLGPNLPDTFYLGAGGIARFRGEPLPLRPEDWIGSTTPRFGAAPAGLTRLAGGELLADAIAADPLDWLGAEHLARFGADPALLVKLIDPGQRVPVHVHPDRGFATEHLSSPYGKTEAWVIIDAPPDGTVNLGFSRDIGADELASWVATQDVASMLAATNEVAVAAGDALLCPAGMPHAIGPGVLMLELQEPSDFSVLLEWTGFSLTAADATLGLPVDLALSCVNRSHCDPRRLAQLRGHRDAVGTLLPAEADGFFIAERLGAGRLGAAFSILVVTAGSGQLQSATGTPMALQRGQTVLVPFAAGECTLRGDVTVLRCRSAA
jgi:mannose-6-phosphate isomerase